MGSILQWVQTREQKGLWKGILLQATVWYSPSATLKQDWSNPWVPAPGWGDAAVMPRAMDHLHPSQELGAVQPAWVWVRHLGLAWSSTITLQLVAPQLTFSPACSSAEDSDCGQKQGRRVARRGPWPTVAIMVSGFITVLNGMTVGHNKSASLLSKSQTIKGLAVKVIHHHKDLRCSSLQFHSHS